MRITFYEPSGDLNADDLHCVLLLAGVNVSPMRIMDWTPNEFLMAYDWSMREHLGASDNPVRRRPCPSFVREADEGMAL